MESIFWRACAPGTFPMRSRTEGGTGMTSSFPSMCVVPLERQVQRFRMRRRSLGTATRVANATNCSTDETSDALERFSVEPVTGACTEIAPQLSWHRMVRRRRVLVQSGGGDVGLAITGGFRIEKR